VSNFYLLDTDNTEEARCAWTARTMDDDVSGQPLAGNGKCVETTLDGWEGNLFGQPAEDEEMFRRSIGDMEVVGKLTREDVEVFRQSKEGKDVFA
jgi:hypothetical protein